jgi:hypothetical protein
VDAGVERCRCGSGAEDVAAQLAGRDDPDRRRSVDVDLERELEWSSGRTATARTRGDRAVETRIQEIQLELVDAPDLPVDGEGDARAVAIGAWAIRAARRGSECGDRERAPHSAPIRQSVASHTIGGNRVGPSSRET